MSIRFDVLVSQIKELELQTIHFSTIAAASSAILVFSLFAPNLLLSKPYPTASAAAASNHSKVLQLKSKSIVPEQLNFQGLIVAGLSPLNIALNPMPQRTSAQINKGDFENVYKEAGKKYGVPWEIIAGVHYVETNQSGDTNRKSSAGAEGPMQFMQPTFDAYQQDGDGDGVKSIDDVHDAIYTAANHLAANGAGKGNVRQALFLYNHSEAYVDRVLNYAVSVGYKN